MIPVFGSLALAKVMLGLGVVHVPTIPASGVLADKVAVKPQVVMGVPVLAVGGCIQTIGTPGATDKQLSLKSTLLGVCWSPATYDI